MAAAGTPLSLNRYTYGHSDPTLLVDPSWHNVVQAIINNGLCLLQTIFDVPNLIGQAVTNNWDSVATFLSYVAPMVPVLGPAYMFTDGLFGRDWLTGKALTNAQAQQMMLAGVPGLVLDAVGGAYFQPFIGEGKGR